MSFANNYARLIQDGLIQNKEQSPEARQRFIETILLMYRKDLFEEVEKRFTQCLDELKGRLSDSFIQDGILNSIR